MDFLDKNIISIEDFSKDDILKILSTAEEIEKSNNNKLLEGKILATLFFEPSTRTRLSHESAMLRLGGKVLGFSDPSMTSGKKGETLQDTIRMVHHYCDVIVIRHYLEGAALEAAKVSKVPIINAGDGANQHPTQTFLDLYSIKKTQNRLDNVKVAIVGDLKYGRTVHSLAKGISHFSPELYFVAPKSLQMPDYILDNLTKNNINFMETQNIEDIIDKVDILYMTRIQQERFDNNEEYEKVKDIYELNKSMLKGCKSNMRIFHPFPRVNEINVDVDETPHAYYFEQAGNAVPVRQALFSLVLGAKK
ncbi:aspartate carbamoyltransferase [Candidatus Woesearchaeota archaeon]|nr:MAG: aspartate carbamoyltransferase [Candidatus Woesearchaeota archaeon]